MIIIATKVAMKKDHWEMGFKKCKLISVLRTG